MTEQTQKNLNLWRLGFMLLLGLILGIILAKTVLSMKWPLGKQATCDFIIPNATYAFEECDKLWCDIIECNYNSSLSACVCIKGYVLNESSMNATIYNLSGYYNKTDLYNRTEIEELFKANNLSYNDTELKSKFQEKLDLGDYTNFTAYRITIQQRLSRLEEIQPKSKNSSGGISSGMLAFIISAIIVALIIIVIIYLGFKRVKAEAHESTLRKEEPSQSKLSDKIKSYGKEEEEI